MNIRKSADYSAMFVALDELMQKSLPQMELYLEIGRLTGTRAEKGAAVAASEYLRKIYSDVSGFSPRNLRRMREFFHTYENCPGLLAEAMKVGWTCNVLILEKCASEEERRWYIWAVLHFGWSKKELSAKIDEEAYLHMGLVFSEDTCYIDSKEKDSEEEEKAARALPQDMRVAEPHAQSETRCPGNRAGRIRRTLPICGSECEAVGAYCQGSEVGIQQRIFRRRWKFKPIKRDVTRLKETVHYAA